VFRAVITAIPFLIPLFFQLGFGWTAAQAGLAVAPLFLGNALIKPATTPLMRRFGIRTVMLTSILASAACLAGIAFLQPTTPLPLLLGVLTLSGAFRSIGFTTYNSLACQVPGLVEAGLSPADALPDGVVGVVERLVLSGWDEAEFAV
jgi:MFS family permease